MTEAGAVGTERPVLLAVDDEGDVLRPSSATCTLVSTGPWPWQSPPFRSRPAAPDLAQQHRESADLEVATPETATAILAAFAGHRLQPLILLALHTGARQGELLGLRWEEMDLDAPEPTIRISHQLQRRQLVETKTKRSRRTLPLTTAAVEALRERRRQQREEELAAPAWTGTELVALLSTPVGETAAD